MRNHKKYMLFCFGALCLSLSGCSAPSAQTPTASQNPTAAQTSADAQTSTAAQIPADAQAEDARKNISGDRDANPGGDAGRNRGVNDGGRGGRGGGMAVETDEAVLSVLTENAEKFEQLTFEDPETGASLEYNLYIPEGYSEENQYPLLMFIPDATAPGKTSGEIVEQYFGADIWQAKHPSFVLVPNFSEVVVNDEASVSDQVETAVRLIDALTEEYSIDTNRLYTTGQSMGCMTSLYLNSKYPALFAASLFVSGQWDISVLEPLEGASFFYITAAGDEKASGGQDQVMAMFDVGGIGYGQWSAQDSEDDQSAAAEELIAQGHDANFIRFELGSVLKDGNTMEHMASFNYAYRIPAVRDWLFEQRK